MALQNSLKSFRSSTTGSLLLCLSRWESTETLSLPTSPTCFQKLQSIQLHICPGAATTKASGQLLSKGDLKLNLLKSKSRYQLVRDTILSGMSMNPTGKSKSGSILKTSTWVLTSTGPRACGSLLSLPKVMSLAEEFGPSNLRPRTRHLMMKKSFSMTSTPKVSQASKLVTVRGLPTSITISNLLLVQTLYLIKTLKMAPKNSVKS